MTELTRHVLVFAPSKEVFRELCNSIKREPWVEAELREGGCTWTGRGLRLEVDVVEEAPAAAELLHSGYYNMVIVDCRHVAIDGVDHERQERCLNEFLDGLTHERDIERAYPLRRVAVLLGDRDEERVDRMLFEMGKRHVGACLRDPALSARPTGGKAEARSRFVDQLWRHCQTVMTEGRPGKKALACAGGGITGIYYEVGVIKCLHDAFDVDIRDFDLFLGISGGAVVSSCLANGIAIDEIIAKIGDLDKTWNYRLKLSWRQLNLLEVPRRLVILEKEMFRYAGRLFRREDELSVASILGLYAVLLGPLFDNKRFEKAIRRLFKKGGQTNDFRELTRELYIGATDQDRREHVLFGAPGFDDVPISVAVQASAAMHPFFPPVEIGGRYYTDGIVTRTANLGAAIDHGADLVFVVDPFLPRVSDTPGYYREKGNMWVVEQDYKTLSYTRFSQARHELARTHPDVNTYSFVPSNRMRRLMGRQNPFIARNFHPIVCEAYRGTFRRLKTLEYKIRGELRSHNIHLDLEPVEEKVELLRRAKRPDVRLLLGNGSLKKSRVA